MSEMRTHLSASGLGFKCKWSHLSSPILIRLIAAAFIWIILSPEDVLYVALDLLSKIKYAVCQWDDEPVTFWGFLLLKSFVLGVFGDATESSDVSDLTNCIFKFWSNMTLRLLLYLCTRVWNSFNCRWTHWPEFGTTWLPDWYKLISAARFFLRNMLMKSTLVPNHFKKLLCVF